ncbi:MAG: Calx-beta domain-containing protein, partial [Microcystis panniformis]
VQEDGTTNLVYTFTRTNLNLSSPLTVNFGASGIANAAPVGSDPADYTVLTNGSVTFNPTTKLGTVTFAANATTATVEVDPIADTVQENSESVILTVNSGTGYIGDSPNTATGTIISEEGFTTYFSDDFANNSKGWTLGTEWQIGAATASTGHVYGNPDPGTDNTPTADNGVAGVVIGGNASTALHGFYYLTSPVINTSTANQLFFEFARWLNSDYTPYMQNTVEIFNGSSWVNLLPSNFDDFPGVTDNAWTPQQFNISAHKSASTQIRFGFNVTSDGVYTVSSWNLDDVKIYGDGGVTTKSISIAKTTDGKEAGPVSSVFTLTRTGDLSSALTVNYTLAGTATLGSDYNDPSLGQATFAAGADKATITLPTIDDSVVDPSETIITKITAPAGYTISGPDTATATIIDDDLGTLTLGKTIDGNEAGSVSSVFTLTRTGDLSSALTVNYTLAGTATPGVDYTGTTPNTVTFAALSPTATITLPTIDDSVVDPSETIITKITAPTGYTISGSDTATATIVDNDGGGGGNIFSNPNPISIDDEFSGGTNPYPSTISVSGLSGNINNLKVTINDVSHTWIGDVDILLVGPTGAKSILMSDIGEALSVSGVNLTFDTSATTLIDNSNVGTSGSYKPNDIDGGDGDFFDSPAPVGPYKADLSVFNNTSGNGTWSLYAFDDFQFVDVGSIAGGWSLTIGTAAPTKSISIAKTTDGKEAGPVSSVFTLTRTGDLSSALTVNYTLAGTATPGVDYTGTTPNTVTFAALSPTATITLPTKDDLLSDPSETIITKITAPVGYTISGPDTATATILDNDGNSANDNLVGTSFADALAGVGGNDTLDGGAGNDTLDGGADNDTYLFDTDLVLGSDLLIDASGIDTLNFAATTAKTINLNLGSTVAQTVTAGNLTLTLASATAFENVIGGSLNDNIVGNTLANSLTGGAGNDNLNGGAGNDNLTGGLGKDTLTGSTGLDTLTYNSLGESLLSGFDVIQGYSGTGTSLDRINAPAPIPATTLTASKGTASALTEAAIKLVLTNAAFAANTAAAFKVTGQSGTFIALNNGVAGFQAASDAIIQLSGYNIAAATPVVVI